MMINITVFLYIVVIIIGMIAIAKGWSEFKLKYYLIGIIFVATGLLGLGYGNCKYTNKNDMKKSYKFNTLEQMRFDDYGFGLFIIGNDLCFKSADGKTYTVGDGSEISVCKEAKITPLEE